MQDVESALTYAFRQEIAIHKSMNEEALGALKAYVLVLAKVKNICFKTKIINLII